MKETTDAPAGGTSVIDPANYKSEFHVNLRNLRTVCEKANNWHEIQPLLNRFGGSFDNFIESLST